MIVIALLLTSNFKTHAPDHSEPFIRSPFKLPKLRSLDSCLRVSLGECYRVFQASLRCCIKIYFVFFNEFITVKWSRKIRFCVFCLFPDYEYGIQACCHFRVKHGRFWEQLWQQCGFRNFFRFRRGTGFRLGGRQRFALFAG